jgi:hypothetical protein
VSTFEKAVRRIRRRAARGSLTAAERARLRSMRRQIEEMDRQAAARQLDRRLHNGGGATHIEEAALMNLTIEQPTITPERAERGGQRQPDAWLQEVHPEDEP